MRVFHVFFALLCLTTQLFASEEILPEPYNSIQDLPFDEHGWFMNAEQLKLAIEEHPIHKAIEVGSWLGASTRFIASHVPETAKVYAVDTWLGSMTRSEKHFFVADPRLPYAFQLFLSNVKHAKLTSKIVPVRMYSLEAAKALNIMADLIYIDASHEEQNVYNDIMAWIKHLNTDGIMCGDDWTWKSVQKGVTKAAQELHLQIYAKDNFWRFY